jgi:hypothetical protein
MAFWTGIWEIPNVKSNHIEKTVHPCQLPVESVERCVLSMTNENDIVFDSYAGVASSLVAAVKHGRRAFGVDCENEYIQVGRKRLCCLLDGELEMRPIGKSIHKPNGHEKITQIPLEWRQIEGSAYR